MSSMLSSSSRAGLLEARRSPPWPRPAPSAARRARPRGAEAGSRPSAISNHCAALAGARWAAPSPASRRTRPPACPRAGPTGRRGALAMRPVRPRSARAAAARPWAGRRAPAAVDSYTALRTSGCRKPKRRGTSPGRTRSRAASTSIAVERLRLLDACRRDRQVELERVAGYRRGLGEAASAAREPIELGDDRRHHGGRHFRRRGESRRTPVAPLTGELQHVERVAAARAVELLELGRAGGVHQLVCGERRQRAQLHTAHRCRRRLRRPRWPSRARGRPDPCETTPRPGPLPAAGGEGGGRRARSRRRRPSGGPRARGPSAGGRRAARSGRARRGARGSARRRWSARASRVRASEVRGTRPRSPRDPRTASRLNARGSSEPRYSSRASTTSPKGSSLLELGCAAAQRETAATPRRARPAHRADEVFPMPGSPVTNTIRGAPATASSSSCSARCCSCSRPTRAAVDGVTAFGRHPTAGQRSGCSP